MLKPRTVKYRVCLPHRVLGGNSHKNYGHYARIYRQFKEAFKEKIKIQGVRQLRTPVSIHYTFDCGAPYETKKDKNGALRLTKVVDNFYRPKDGENATYSMKAALDAIKELGIVTDDTTKHVTVLPPTINDVQSKHNGRQGVTITLRELEG